jgi:hypothetical protein
MRVAPQWRYVLAEGDPSDCSLETRWRCVVIPFYIE